MSYETVRQKLEIFIETHSFVKKKISNFQYSFYYYTLVHGEHYCINFSRNSKRITVIIF